MFIKSIIESFFISILLSVPAITIFVMIAANGADYYLMPLDVFRWCFYGIPTGIFIITTVIRYSINNSHKYTPQYVSSGYRGVSSSRGGSASTGPYVAGGISGSSYSGGGDCGGGSVGGGFGGGGGCL